MLNQLLPRTLVSGLAGVSLRSQRWFVLPLLLVLTLTLGACGSDEPEASPNDARVSFVEADQRVAAPALSGATIAGEELSIAPWLGTPEEPGDVVVINVWGSWCPPCREESPMLGRLAKELAPAGVQFVGINIRDNDAAARSFAQKAGMDFPSFSNPDSSMVLDFRDSLPLVTTPSTVVVDRQGRVAGRLLGEADEYRLRQMIDDVATA